MSDSEDDVPLGARTAVVAATAATAEPKSDSDSDAPLSARRKTPVAAVVEKRPKSEVASDSDSDVPLAKKLKKEPNGAAKPAAKRAAKPASKNGAVTREKPAPAAKKRPRSAKADADVKVEEKAKTEKKSVKESPSKKVKEDDDDEHKWWLEQDRDDSVKWRTLEHNGPLFPPPYEPHGIKMKYDGQDVDLEPEAEEVATFYAQILGTDWETNVTFQKNFFKDFLAVLAKQKKKPPIKKFELCDFSPIAEYVNQEKERKKNLTKEEKLRIKEDKMKLDEKYGVAFLDGRKEKVGNYRIEPPGLFRGRGEHPKTGFLKTRVAPEQVTINIGEGAKVPEPPEGHNWGEVTHDNTVTWLAMWKENVNESIKYIFLAANSSLKGQSDLKKFEKARSLKSLVHGIRKDYTRELKDKAMATRQRATAMYFIDRLALRAGNEKGEDEADTVGCCSLRFEHICLEPPNKVIFDFLGKDSIRYYNELDVDLQVFKNLKLFKKAPKKEGDDLFDRLNTSGLNKHLATYMPGLTAKVFRTYNASFTFQEELQATPENGTVAEKILAYQRANRRVAKLCNHQRAVPKGHSSQIDKIKQKIRALKYERMLVSKEILELEPKLKKKRPELVEAESDLDEEFIASHKQFLAEKEQERLAVKLEKDNEKRVAEGLKPLKSMPETAPKARNTSVEKLDKKRLLLTEKIQGQKMLLIDKDENKETALGTSKINYIDPRISAAWCRKYNVPLEKVFNKTLVAKFKWAMDTEPDWEF
ncbi:hypothetical protein PhCBS80983_g02484 [Powellomyces hirtus]|uniref:DNA topoisomerase I n=1 Tax=Powellomyces hirtus TaxID=109895 RepID=A0A507E7S5_9FUNG|nr:hypothetical protein PhCBS80983_g02484 [Powellomyces hirtus]